MKEGRGGGKGEGERGREVKRRRKEGKKSEKTREGRPMSNCMREKVKMWGVNRFRESKTGINTGRQMSIGEIPYLVFKSKDNSIGS